MDLREASRQKLAGPVGHVYFGQQGACSEVDGFGCAYNFAQEFLAGILSQFEVSAKARTNGRGISLRNVDENAEGGGLREVEQLRRGTAIAGVDECTDIDVTSRDYAAEWRINVLERFQLLETTDIGFAGLHDGAFGLEVASGVVDFLFGDAVGFEQFRVTCGSDLGKVLVGLEGVQIGARLREFLIDFGRVDVGKQVTLFHARPDVVIPLFQVTVGARVDGRFDISLQCAG